ncbi:MAG: hypothetical protein DME26_13680 [Verrucomicrobia bacterium]|nr:MAG: hypothetical protein DME26_13680 [Verrucomicrobiota bacterium]
MYLGREGTASSYGAAGSVVVILLWIYYSSAILLFGAEFTQVFALHRGHKLEPSKYAVPITREARAQQGMPKPESVEPERARVYAHKTLGPASAAPLAAAGAAGIVGGSTAGSESSKSTVVKIFPWASLIAAIGIGVATGFRITRDLNTADRRA